MNNYISAVMSSHTSSSRTLSPTTNETITPITIQIDDSLSSNSSYPKLTLSSPKTSTVVIMDDLDDQSSPNEKDVERKKSRKSMEEPKNKRKDTTTSFTNFIHRFTRSEKDEKHKSTISDEDATVDRPDKLLIPATSSEWYQLKEMNTDNFRTALDMGNEAGMPTYEWKADSLEEYLLTESPEERRELLRIESQNEVNEMEKSLSNMLDEFRSGQMRSFTEEQLDAMRAAKREHEDVTNLHLSIYSTDCEPEQIESRLDDMYNQMSGLLAKLFPDVNNLESIIKVVNGLATNEDRDDAVQKVTELVRKNRDIIDKQATDLEPFLLECNTDVSSPVIVAAIRSMYDTCSSRNMEAGLDRSVELLKHYLDEGRLVADHLRYCPDIFFPLVRKCTFYCLEKKNEPLLGFNIAQMGMSLVVCPENRLVSSLHSAFLCLCIKTGNYEAALPYIYSPVGGIINECPPTAVSDGDKQANSTRKWHCPGTGTGQYFDAKFMLQYLYYSAIILLKVGRTCDALRHLECCLVFPGNSASQIQLDAFKKYYIVSLILNGSLSIPAGRSSAMLRAWKTKCASEPYARLVSSVSSRGDCAQAVQNVLLDCRDVFAEDNNIGLIEMLIENIKTKAVLNVAKCFSSISLANLAARSYCTEEQLVYMVQELVESGRLMASIDNGVVSLELPAPVTSRAEVDEKLKRLDFFYGEVNRMDLVAQLNPALLARTIKGSTLTYLQDDEGLSMTNSPIDM